jgi:iron-sulfur cluster repair protein YtfE (RIC family)
VDVLDHLTEEHRTAERLLAQLKDSEPGDERKRLLAALSDALTVHMEIEEDQLYPLVEEHIGVEKAEGAETEHDLARDGLEKLAELVDRPGFGAAVAMLTAGIDHHVTEEEGELFPALRDKAAAQIEAMADPEELLDDALEALDDEALDDMGEDEAAED